MRRAGVFDEELPLKVCFASARPDSAGRVVDTTGLGPPNPNPNAGVATAAGLLQPNATAAGTLAGFGAVAVLTRLVLAVSPANRSGRRRRRRSSIVSCNPCGTNATDLGIVVFGGIATLGGRVTASLRKGDQSARAAGSGVQSRMSRSLSRELEG